MESFASSLSVDLNYFLLPSPQIPESSPVDRFKCKRCQEIFKSFKGLGIHETKMHDSSPKIFACLGCFKSYRTSYELKVHQRKVHLNTLQILCSKCGKLFSSKGSFKVHYKKFHPIMPTIN